MLVLEQIAHRLRRFGPLIRAMSACPRENCDRTRLCNTTTVAATPQGSGNAARHREATDDESRKCNSPLGHPIYDQTFPLELNIRNLLRPGAATVT